MSNLPKVLVIDDYKIIISLIEKLLGKEFEVFSAMNGKEGIKIAEELLPDLILLDIDMPYLSGFDVIKILKEKNSTKDIPVIFLTGRNKAEDIIKGLELGGVDYINKPFNFKELKLRVNTHIKLKKYQDILKNRAIEIEKEIKMAKAIQSKILPSSPPNEKISFLYKPMYMIGGDFFDIIKIRDNVFGVFISDVSGHGIPAAFITSMIKSFIKESKDINNPANLLSFINDRMVDLSAGNFITAFYGVFDFYKKSIEFSNAGHPAPILLNESVTVLDIKNNGLPLGIYSSDVLEKMGKSYYNNSLKINSKIILYTDGLLEAVSTVGEIFEDRLFNLLSQCKNMGSKNIIDFIYKGLVEFRSSENFDDDICILAIDFS